MGFGQITTKGESWHHQGAFAQKRSGLKHRIAADFSVFINTGQEFDGSDSGARPDEAISWGKIRLTAEPVKLYAEATLVWPFIVAETFAKDFDPEAWAKEVAGMKTWL